MRMDCSCSPLRRRNGFIHLPRKGSSSGTIVLLRQEVRNLASGAGLFRAKWVGLNAQCPYDRMEPYGSAIVLATKRPGWQKRWKAVSDSVLLAYPRSQRTAACAPRKPRTLRVVAAQFKWGIEPEWLPNENCWSDSQVWKSVARPV